MKRQNTFQDWLDKWRVSSQLIDLVHKCFGLEHTPVLWYGHDACDDDATKYDDDDNIHATDGSDMILIMNIWSMKVLMFQAHLWMENKFSKCIAACDDDCNDSDKHDDFDNDTKDDGDGDNFDGTGGTDMILMIVTMMKLQNWELHLLCDPHIQS